MIDLLLDFIFLKYIIESVPSAINSILYFLSSDGKKLKFSLKPFNK